MMVYRIFAVALLMVFAPFSVGGPILYVPNGGMNQLAAFDPLGQSFVAEDTSVEAGLFFAEMNPGFANDPIQYSLYEGLGSSGAFVGLSGPVQIELGFTGFVLADFSFLTLTSGDTYTLMAEVASGSPLWGVSRTSAFNAGSSVVFFNGSESSSRTRKFALSVNPVTPSEPAPVPGPATIALFSLGLAGLGWSRRKKA